jgi:hypothetical protein
MGDKVLSTKRRDSMNKVLMSMLFSAFFLTGSSFAQAPTPAEAPAVPAVAVPETVKPVHHMHNQEIHKAIHKLRGAKQDLEKAAHDFGGHKAKAIEAIDRALEELNAALEFDRK